jgi:ABC-type uncharacterized transport system permease subunit
MRSEHESCSVSISSILTCNIFILILAAVALSILAITAILAIMASPARHRLFNRAEASGGANFRPLASFDSRLFAQIRGLIS